MTPDKLVRATGEEIANIYVAIHRNKFKCLPQTLSAVNSFTKILFPHLENYEVKVNKLGEKQNELYTSITNATDFADKPEKERDSIVVKLDKTYQRKLKAIKNKEYELVFNSETISQAINIITMLEVEGVKELQLIHSLLRKLQNDYLQINY